MADLPRPTVTVTHGVDGTTGATSTDVVISRDNKARSYSVPGSADVGVVRQVVEKVIGDPRTAEWLP